MRVIIVGDVHGCIEELEELLLTTDYLPAVDRLIFVGDLLDRGPDPVGCLRWVRDRAECVLSNHDEKHLRYRQHSQRVLSTPGYTHPMRPYPPDRQAEHDELTDEDLAWVATLPVSIRFEVAGRMWQVMHAGTAAGRQKTSQIIRTRHVDPVTGAHVRGVVEGAVYWTDRYRGADSIIYGHHIHTLEAQVTQSGRCFGIDTGCVFGGHLTALVLREDGSVESCHVKAKKTYVSLDRGRNDE